MTATPEEVRVHEQRADALGFMFRAIGCAVIAITVLTVAVAIWKMLIFADAAADIAAHAKSEITRAVDKAAEGLGDLKDEFKAYAADKLKVVGEKAGEKADRAIDALARKLGSDKTEGRD